MDAWSADQLKKMQVGGNGKLNAFFKNYGIAKETEIKQKYSGQVAEVRLAKRSTMYGRNLPSLVTDYHEPSQTFLVGCSQKALCLVWPGHNSPAPSQIFLDGPSIIQRPPTVLPGCPQIYREKLRAEVEGRPYTPPPPSEVKAPSRSASSSSSMSRSRSAGRVAAGTDDWDEWGDGAGAKVPPAAPKSQYNWMMLRLPEIDRRTSFSVHNVCHWWYKFRYISYVPRRDAT